MMKTFFSAILLSACIATGCAAEKSIRIDRLAGHKTDYVFWNPNRNERQESLLRASEKTKEIYSLIGINNGIYFRERDSKGRLLVEREVTGGTNDWFSWFYGARTGDYEPTTKRLAYLNNGKDLILCEFSNATRMTRVIWRSEAEICPEFIRFADPNHILLIYDETEGTPYGMSSPLNMVLVSVAGEKRQIAKLEASLSDEYRLNDSGILYFIGTFSGEKVPYLGYVNLFENPAVIKRVVELPRNGVFAFDVSRDGKRVVVVTKIPWANDGKNKTVTRLSEYDVSTGMSHEITTFAKDDKAKAVYPCVRYVNDDEVAVCICPNTFWNWAGSHDIRLYNLKSGKELQEVSDPNLILFDMLHEDGEAVMISSVN